MSSPSLRHSPFCFLSIIAPFYYLAFGGFAPLNGTAAQKGLRCWEPVLGCVTALHCSFTFFFFVIIPPAPPTHSPTQPSLVCVGARFTRCMTCACVFFVFFVLAFFFVAFVRTSSSSVVCPDFVPSCWRRYERRHHPIHKFSQENYF